MSNLSSQINQGILNLPAADPKSKATAELLLKKDHDIHHCFFRPNGFHNHLSHHILAAYDLGAPAALIQAIYDDEAKIQRPIDLKENGVVPEGLPTADEIKEDNWTNWLGDAKAYSAYMAFFSAQIARLGIVKTLDEYVFSPAANGNGSHMLLRLFGGAFHPYIQVGYGLEFGSEIQVAAGIAQAAVHEARADGYLPLEEFLHSTSLVNGTGVRENGRQPHKGPSILSILREIYDSPELIPVLPYEPDALLSKRLRDFKEGGTRLVELKRIFAGFNPGDTYEAIESRVEELVFASTLLTFGTGRKGRKPRLDFFLMHLLTSSLFLPTYLKHLPNIENQKALLRIYLQPWGSFLVIRGRPRIDAALLMSYTDHPMPPYASRPKPHESSIGGENKECVTPFPAIIADALHAPDAHTIKTLRTLLYGARQYGTVPKGGIIGALGRDGKDTHPGIIDADGTIFVRAAGVLMDTLGWYGQAPGNWDRSGLGWDDAWKGED